MTLLHYFLEEWYSWSFCKGDVKISVCFILPIEIWMIFLFTTHKSLSLVLFLQPRIWLVSCPFSNNEGLQSGTQETKGKYFKEVFVIIPVLMVKDKKVWSVYKCFFIYTLVFLDLIYRATVFTLQQMYFKFQEWFHFLGVYSCLHGKELTALSTFKIWHGWIDADIIFLMFHFY